MKTSKTPQIIKDMLMIIGGSVSIPNEVKKQFSMREDNPIANVWFSLMEGDFIFKQILFPEQKPQALETAILALTNNQEIQECVESTAYVYLEYMQKKYSHIGALKSFCILELGKIDGRKPTALQNQKVYKNLLNWLERSIDHVEIFEHEKEISDLIKVLLFSKSDILNYDEFIDFWEENKLDLIALMQ